MINFSGLTQPSTVESRPMSTMRAHLVQALSSARIAEVCQ